MARTTITLDEGLPAALLEWRRNQPDLPNESEAIRRLLRAALEHEGIFLKNFLQKETAE